MNLSSAATILMFGVLTSVAAQSAAGWGEPSVRAFDQRIDNGCVTVASATAARRGWIAVHFADVIGEYEDNTVAGFVPVEAGVHADIKVPLTRAVQPGRLLFVTLHDDKGVAGHFEFSASNGLADEPVLVDGVPVFATMTAQ